MSEYNIPNGEHIPITAPERELQPHEIVEIDLDSEPLVESEELIQKLGLSGNVVASIDAAGTGFLLVDKRGTDSNRDFLLVDGSFNEEKRTGFKGLEAGRPVTIGRSHLKERFQYGELVSRDHFRVLYKDGKVLVQNLNPTNETTIQAHLVDEDSLTKPTVDEDDDEILSGRTIQAWERVSARTNYGEKDPTAPYGYFMNHPILGRNSRILDGGVYLGGSSREAIVVDGKSRILKSLSDSIEANIQKSIESGSNLRQSDILDYIMKMVDYTLPYDEAKVDEISDANRGDKLVGLSTFVEERAGVCRQQSLLTGYLVENLIKSEVLKGAVAVERNSIKGKGAHGWAVFKPEDGSEPIVIDATQRFLGTKDEARRKGAWNYSVTTNEVA